MSKTFSKGTAVSWPWGRGQGKGKIKESYDHTVHKQIKGATITRQGTADNPAYLIEQANGNHVLNSMSTAPICGFDVLKSLQQCCGIWISASGERHQT